MDKETNVTLLDIYPRYASTHGGGDKGTDHTYMEIYQQEMDRRYGASLLEIGVWEGHSIAMWEEYFVDGFVLGLDTDLSRLKFDCNVKKCNATNKDELDSVIGEMAFTYIIDDGSHHPDDQIRSLELLWDHVLPGGKYFIEDIRGDQELNQVMHHVKQMKTPHYLHDNRKLRNRYDDILLVLYK
jgi:hypothetical protein